MILIHSECGGALEVDWSAPRELIDNGRTTEIYTPIKCAGCNAKLGMLPNAAMGSPQTNVAGRMYDRYN